VLWPCLTNSHLRNVLHKRKVKCYSKQEMSGISKPQYRYIQLTDCQAPTPICRVGILPGPKIRPRNIRALYSTCCNQERGVGLTAISRNTVESGETLEAAPDDQELDRVLSVLGQTTLPSESKPPRAAVASCGPAPTAVCMALSTAWL
jgi:hypothetical protein